jgi:hypothetical protein
MRDKFPCGKAVRATRAVSSGTGGIGCGWRDINSLLGSVAYGVQASREHLLYVSNDL